MEKSTVPPQLTRLAMVTVGIVVIYFVARIFLVPASFGKYGWYRGDVLEEYRALPLSYGGQAVCVDCHSQSSSEQHVNIITEKLKGAHRTVSCETCHGPQQQHVVAEKRWEIAKAREGMAKEEETSLQQERTAARPPKADTSRALCLRCHQSSPSRPPKFPQIIDAGHNADAKCIECHDAHNPKM